MFTKFDITQSGSILLCLDPLFSSHFLIVSSSTYSYVLFQCLLRLCQVRISFAEVFKTVMHLFLYKINKVDKYGKTNGASQHGITKKTILKCSYLWCICTNTLITVFLSFNFSFRWTTFSFLTSLLEYNCFTMVC